MNFDALHGPILAAVNLLGVLLCGAFLAYACARFHWRRSGFGLMAFGLIFCNLIWLVPQAISASAFHSPCLLFDLWFPNWLVSAFSAVLLSRVFADVPQQLEDAGRLDGFGTLQTFRHVIWPFAKSSLLMIGIITAMATFQEFLQPMLPASGPDFSLGFGIADLQSGTAVAKLVAASLILSLPIVAIAFVAGRPVTQRHEVPDGAT